MSLFVISDLHLSLDPSIDKPMDVFDDAWKNHTQRLKENWEGSISASDTVLVPGDISWGIDLRQADADLRFIDNLPGQKVLVRGNHDYWWSSMAKMKGLYRTINYIQNNAFVADDYIVCGSRGWYLPWHSVQDFTKEESEKIYKRELLRLEMSLQEASKKRGERSLIAAVHFPPLDNDHTTTDFTKLFEKYGVSIVVYGHLHGKHIKEAVEGKIDNIQYKLVSLDKLDAMPLKLL